MLRIGERYIIPNPVKSLIHKLAEVGHLYSRIDTFVKGREGRSGGMTAQSLCHHLESQLTEYYRVIAVLESQISIARHTSDGNAGLGEETILTLKRLDIWINEWRLRMRMMSVCVEGARGKTASSVDPIPEDGHPDAQGGALVNLIHNYTDNGDPFVRKFTDQLLEEARLTILITNC